MISNTTQALGAHKANAHDAQTDRQHSGEISGHRIDWVDTAKGICIILVVMMHTTLGVEAAAGAEGWMHLFVAFAGPFRMPDFFLISGLFMAQAIARDWRTFADRRILHFAYFYILWLVISAVMKGVLGGDGPNEILQSLITGLYQPYSTLWFIYMLAIFSVTLKLTRRIPVPVMLAFAAGLNLLPIETGHLLIDQFAGQFVFFYVGYAFAQQVFRLGTFASQNAKMCWVGLVIWALVNGGLVAYGWHHVAPIALGLGLAGAAAIVVTSSLIVTNPLGRGLSYMGARSIVIYLSFFIPMAFSRVVAIDFGLVDLDPGTLSFTILLIAVLSPLIGERIIRHTPLNFVFVRPNWAKIERTKTPPKTEPPSPSLAITPAE